MAYFAVNEVGAGSRKLEKKKKKGKGEVHLAKRVGKALVWSFRERRNEVQALFVEEGGKKESHTS